MILFPQMEILRFISAVFYGGPDKLTASGNIPSVVELTPLQFYAVQGREVQESDSTSYHNQAESSEVVERVMELLDNWPLEWGKVAPEQIGIVTPYHDQVRVTRFAIRFLTEVCFCTCSGIEYVVVAGM